MLRNSRTGFGWVAITLHWTTAIIVAAQFTLGLVMVDIADQRSSFELIQLHKSIGFSLLAIVVLRLAWRSLNPRPELPAGMPRLERVAARLSHGLLYAGLVAVPLAGWMLVSASPLDIPSMPFGLFVMPDLPVARNEAAEAFWSEAHEILAWCLVSLVVVHAAAALNHHFRRQDGVLRRMLRPAANGEAVTSPLLRE